MRVKSTDTIAEFKVMLLFGLSHNPSFTPVSRTMEVYWLPPDLGCIKINVDGSAFGWVPCCAIGGVCRDWQTHSVGGFAQNIGQATCLESEFCAVMYGIEKSAEMNCNNIWIESDSVVVVKAFSDPSHVPWKSKTLWFNCLSLARQRRCVCSHISRDGNHVADTLAKNGQALSCFYCIPLLD